MRVSGTSCTVAPFARSAAASGDPRSPARVTAMRTPASGWGSGARAGIRAMITAGSRADYRPRFARAIRRSNTTMYPPYAAAVMA